MSNITLSLPESVHRIVREHKEIRWSEIARAAISSHAAKLEMMDAIASKSRLTMSDIEQINEKIKHGLFKRYSDENSYRH